MLSFGEEKNDIFREIDSLVSSLSLIPVEVSKIENKNSISLKVVLYKKDSEINTDDLEKAYNLLFPRYSVLFDSRDLTLEVSSPGLQRTLKDYHEFSVFEGKRVRLYSVSFSSYVSGIVKSTDEKSVVLTNYIIEDKKEEGEEVTLLFSDIAKAKLDYKWEDKNDKSHK